MLSIILSISTTGQISAEDVRKHVYFLASDYTEGRLSGSHGNEVARKYIEFYLKKLGYDVVEQEFPIPGKIHVEEFSVEPDLPLKPLYFSSSGDVRGKVGKEIQVIDADSLSEFDMMMKAIDARENGKKAVIFLVSRPILQRSYFRNDLKIVALQMDKKDANLLKDGQELHIRLKVKKENITGVNVIAVKKGKPGSRYIMVGAHYDHLGYGPMGSMKPDLMDIHNGADDNASGVAGVLELAEYFANRNTNHGIVFVFWDAEELGLLGSKYYIDHPTIPLDSILAYINFDMIGRMRDSTLYLIGIKTAEEFKGIVDSLKGIYGLKIKSSDSGFGSSDQNAFYSSKVPVLHFFTGAHSDYHTPFDDAEKLNYEGEETVVKLARDFILTIDNLSSLKYVKVEMPSGPSRTRLKVSLGVIPDYTSSDGEGLRIFGTRKDSPAYKAGLREGDIIVRIGDYRIKNIYDLMYVLSRYNPGDEAEIVFLRDGKEMKSRVRFQKARRMR